MLISNIRVTEAWAICCIEKVYIERTRLVNFIKLGGGDPLCTLYIEQKDCSAGLDAWGI